MKIKIVLSIIGIIAVFSIPDYVWAASLKRSLRQVNEAVKTQVGVDADLTESLTEAQIQEEIESVLIEPLTEEGAVKIAILNNPSLRAAIAGLGISQADLIQGGLLHNPTFSASIRESNEEGSKTNSEFEIKQDVMDLLFWPLRKRLANSQFKQAEYDLAKTIVDFIKEVRAEFYSWQAADYALLMRQDYFKAQESNIELAQRQKDAGNINKLVLAEHKAAFQEAKIALTRAQLETDTTAHRLKNILGLTTSEVSLQSAKSLPELPLDEFFLDDLEEKTLDSRIDLAMKRQEIKILEQSMAMARLGIIPEVEAGFNTEREPDGARVKGPVFEAQVPIFDHKQAERLRVKSQIEVSRKELMAMESQALMEVRLAYGQLMSTRNMVETYLEAIPVHQEIVEETLYHYNYMHKGVYDLLRAKQDEINVRQEYIDSLRDYWITRTELEHAVGKKLVVMPAKVKKTTVAKEPMFENKSEHEHHGGHQ